MKLRDVRNRIGHGIVKSALGALVSWKPLTDPEPGFSIVVGVPWNLMYLLPVNLRFVSRTDRSRLARVHVVFDRPEQPGAEAMIERCRREFPDLPLAFHFQPTAAGRLMRGINATTFYHAMNTAVGLRECRTRVLIMHDFDLFPVRPDHFSRIAETIERNNWKFASPELTDFGGLSYADNVLGTWALGIDALWLREHYAPVDIFPRYERIGGRELKLDPTSWIQMRTPQRGIVPNGSGEGFCHVNHLCGTHLDYKAGRRPAVVWRLHYLWYLDMLAGESASMTAATGAMRAAQSSELVVGDFRVDFRGVHVTCANVLRDEVRRMEAAVAGASRPEVEDYLAAFRLFLTRHGDVRGAEATDLAVENADAGTGVGGR